MIKALFDFLKNVVGKNTFPQMVAAKSNSDSIYFSLKKELNSKFKNRHLNYIVERVRNLEWSFEISDDLIIYIANESLKGRRSEGIAKDIVKEFPGVSLTDAKTLALTVFSIQSSQITMLRSKDVGIDWYRWRSCQDSRVRNSHKKMEGVLVNWADPPSPEMLVGEEFAGYYHAGECSGCRCYAEPLVDIKYIKKSPIKVYRDGKVAKMSKAQFKELCLK